MCYSNNANISKNKQGKIMAKYNVIYRIDGVDADEGVDIFEIAPVLTEFGELIKNTNDILGYDQKISVRVKPFEKGSWLTQFLLENTVSQNLLNYASSDEGQKLALLMGLLGIGGVQVAGYAVMGVAKIIKFTRGKVSNFEKNSESGKVRYFSPDGSYVEVTIPEHKLVQSPIIQNNFYNCTVGAIDNIESARSVRLTTDSETTDFDDNMIEAMREYKKSDLQEEMDETVSTLSGVFIKPKKGSYSGDHKAYSFFMGETNIYPVSIEDEGFLQRLKNGEARLFCEDILLVNLEVIQKKDSNNRLSSHYVIKEVLEYIPHKSLDQMSIL